MIDYEKESEYNDYIKGNYKTLCEYFSEQLKTIEENNVVLDAEYFLKLFDWVLAAKDKESGFKRQFLFDYLIDDFQGGQEVKETFQDFKEFKLLNLCIKSILKYKELKNKFSPENSERKNDGNL